MVGSSEKLKLAIVSYINIDNLHSGQKKRIYDLVKGLSGKFQIDYIEISDKKQSELITDLSKDSIRYLKYNLEYNYFIKITINFLYFFSFPFLGIKKSVFIGKWGAYVNRKNIKKWNYDIVISEYFMTSFFFDYITNNPFKVIDLHDIQYLTLQYQIKSESKIAQKMKLFFAKKIELKRLQKADLLMVVNLNEIDLLQKKIATPCVFVPLTLEDDNVENYKKIENFDTISFAYFAALSSERSYTEIKFLIEKILPELTEKHNINLILNVIGSNPSNKIINLIEQHKDVKLIGKTNNIFESFRDVHYALYYWVGNSYGFRTRILDVLKTGTPIFLNKECVSGMGMDNSQALFFFENVDTIRLTIENHKNNIENYHKLSKKCSETIKKFNKVSVYDKLYKELLEFYVLKYK